MQDDQTIPEPLKITLQVTKVFEKLQVPYFIGGSLAPAVYGTIRATMDAELIVGLHIEHIQYLVDCFEDTLYNDKLTIIDALRSG